MVQMRTVRLVMICVVAGVGVASIPTVPPTEAMTPRAPVDCGALALHLLPGMQPPSAKYPFRPAPDAPRTPYTVTVPVYPGMTPLQPPIGSPFSGFVGSPYTQSASVEFSTTASSGAVRSWYRSAMASCGWRSSGSWSGNAGTFPNGISFARRQPAGPTTDIGFGVGPNGSTAVAITVQMVRYPAPPARARIHGPFAQLRIVLSRIAPARGQNAPRNVHVSINDWRVISRVVAAIDRIGAAYSVPTMCPGPLRTAGPAWLTFVRPNGLQVHAFESGPGPCGGLAVGGFRWLIDPGTVWSLILKLAPARR